MSLQTVIVICLITGGIAAAIARAKNTPVGQAFVVGAVLNVIGIIIVACAKPGLPKAPDGMHAVKCPRCNTVQNVPENQRVYECWQCKTSHDRWAAPLAPSPVTPAWPVVRPKRLRCHVCQHVQPVPTDQIAYVCDECGARCKRRAA